jgi:hypothetical protein
MRPLVSLAVGLFLATLAAAEDQGADIRKILAALEAKNPETWAEFRAHGTHKESVPMRCVLSLSDRYGDSPIADRRVSYSVTVSNLDGSVAFTAYMRRKDADAESVALAEHLKDGKAHLAIAKLNTMPDREGTPVVSGIERWETWETDAQAKR